MSTVAYVEGLAFWSPSIRDWRHARAVFALERAPLPNVEPLPQSSLLTPNESRRAPETVVMALHVAAQAILMSGIDAQDVQSVFVSAHGDLPVTDALCRTLAQSPRLVSPTRFHHSVHNVASGYWCIATGCQRASTALSALEFSFAAGLLEALSQCEADRVPVMLVAYDTEAVGPLASVNTSRGRLATALVLSPTRTPRSLFSLGWQTSRVGAAAGTSPRAAVAAGLSQNGMADALPFFEALSHPSPAELSLPLSAGAALGVLLRTCESIAVPARVANPSDTVLDGH